MRRLMLLRHAKAAPQENMPDEERPLVERGRLAMRAVAEFVAAHSLRPDLALVSASRRTRETWELILPAFKPPPHRFEMRLYSAPADRLLKALQETSTDVSSLMLVGHNPGLEDLARYLVGSGDTDALIRFGGTMPTASLAVIDLAGDWKHVEPRSGRLEIFVTPKSLRVDDD